MICLGYNRGAACNNEYFLPGIRPVKQFYRGMMLRVKTSVMICTHCGWFTVGMDQVAELRSKTKKEYDLQSKAKKSNGTTRLRRR